MKKSPLGMMRRASQPSLVLPSSYSCGLTDHTLSSSESSTDTDSDIDDAATLQARLPHVRAVSDFGEVESWSQETAYQKSYQKCLGEMAKLDFGAGLAVKKTRESNALFQPEIVRRQLR